jgi:hypothetical protein
MSVIRDGFETNSSSSHSLIISDDLDFAPDTNFGPIKDGVLTVDGVTDFGWQWDIWCMPGDKLNYLYLEAGSEVRKDRLDQIITENLGVAKIQYFGSADPDSVRSSYRAYIDHQSTGTSSDVWSMTDAQIWGWLTNPNSCIRGGNDNETGPW